MQKQVTAIVIILSHLFVGTVVAADKVAKETPYRCEPTPSMLIEELDPASVSPTNNLRRAIGSPITAVGEPIIFQGIVTDVDCVPVKGAKIVMWQADSFGVSPFDVGGNIDSNFVGSGKTTSDNEGHFQFLSIYPGAKDGMAPKVQLMVTKDGFEPLVTEVFFRGDVRNYLDEAYEAMNPLERQLLEAERGKLGPSDQQYYRFNVSLDGLNAYHSF